MLRRTSRRSKYACCSGRRSGSLSIIFFFSQKCIRQKGQYGALVNFAQPPLLPYVVARPRSRAAPSVRRAYLLPSLPPRSPAERQKRGAPAHVRRARDLVREQAGQARAALPIRQRGTPRTARAARRRPPRRTTARDRPAAGSGRARQGRAARRARAAPFPRRPPQQQQRHRPPPSREREGSKRVGFSAGEPPHKEQAAPLEPEPRLGLRVGRKALQIDGVGQDDRLLRPPPEQVLRGELSARHAHGRVRGGKGPQRALIR